MRNFMRLKKKIDNKVLMYWFVIDNLMKRRIVESIVVEKLHKIKCKKIYEFMWRYSEINVWYSDGNSTVVKTWRCIG